MGALAAINAYSGPPGPDASPLGDALNAVATAVHTAARSGSQATLPGALGLARQLGPVCIG
jgi:hypothetical protein